MRVCYLKKMQNIECSYCGYCGFCGFDKTAITAKTADTAHAIQKYNVRKIAEVSATICPVLKKVYT